MQIALLPMIFHDSIFSLTFRHILTSCFVSFFFFISHRPTFGIMCVGANDFNKILTWQLWLIVAQKQFTIYLTYFYQFKSTTGSNMLQIRMVNNNIFALLLQLQLQCEHNARCITKPKQTNRVESCNSGYIYL